MSHGALLWRYAGHHRLCISFLDTLYACSIDPLMRVPGIPSTQSGLDYLLLKTTYGIYVTILPGLRGQDYRTTHLGTNACLFQRLQLPTSWSQIPNAAIASHTARVLSDTSNIPQSLVASLDLSLHIYMHTHT